MKIGILETGEVHPDLKVRHGDYPAMFAARLGAVDPEFEFAVVRVVSGEMPASPDQADAWLVTGSRHGVYDDLPWIAPLAAFLRDCVTEGVPVVGVCFGHQLLAQALGGRAVKSDRGWALGVQDYDVVTRASWMAELPDRFSVSAFHQDQVVSLPEGATVLARSTQCDYAALAYGDPEHPDAISIQPHPEYDAAFMDDLIVLRSGAVFPAEVAQPARDSLTRTVQSDIWIRLIAQFLQRAGAEANRAKAAAAL